MNIIKKTINNFFNGKPTVVYLMVGLPGSGKSTWSKTYHNDLPIVSRDIIRTELDIAEKGEKVIGNKEQEKLVSIKEYELIDLYCKNKQSFIIDDMNISPVRKKIIDYLRQYNTYIIGVNVKTPLDVCIERRKNQISEKVMEKIARYAIPLNNDEVDEIINVNYN